MSNPEKAAETTVGADELAEHYDLDYNRARSNRFATFALFVDVDHVMLKAICGQRREPLLRKAIAASTREYPTGDSKSTSSILGHVLAGQIYERFVHLVTDANQAAEGGAAALKELTPETVIAVAREWIERTGGFETLPGVDAATAERLRGEFQPGALDAQVLRALDEADPKAGASSPAE
jgi:hypothetical protein